MKLRERIGREEDRPTRPPERRGEALRPSVAAAFFYDSGAERAALLHTDREANQFATTHRATAVTQGADIYYAAHAPAPEQPGGRELLRHELDHVDNYLRGNLASQPPGVVDPHHPLETAPAGAGPVTSPRPPSFNAPLMRQPDLQFWVGDPGAFGGLGATLGLAALAATWDENEEIELRGHTEMPDLLAFSAYAYLYGPTKLKVRFGALARGEIELGYCADRAALVSDGVNEITAAHPKLPDVAGQRLAIDVDHDAIDVALGTNGNTTDQLDVGVSLAWWRRTNQSGLMILPDFVDSIPHEAITNRLDGSGELEFSSGGRYPIALPGPGGARHPGEAQIALSTSGGTIDASAHLTAPGLGDANLELHRLPGGSFTATARMSIGPFGDARAGHRGFSGELTATYGRRVLDITGVASYDGARISGTATLRLTDAVSAWDAVEPHIRAAVGTVPPRPPTASGLALTGWGSMTYRFGDWLTGRAAVAVAPDGHIYSRGEIRPTGNIRFIDPPRRWPRTGVRNLLGPYSASVDVLDVVAFQVEAGGSITLQASSTVGPLSINRLRLVGAFSTNTAVPWQLAIGGELRLDASATVSAIAEVWLKASTLELVPLGDVTATIRGSATVNAAAEADASIGRRLVDGDPEMTEYFIDGRFSAMADLALGLEGSIDFSVLGIGWNLWNSDHHEWPLGSTRLSRNLSYTFGRSQPNAVSVEPSFGEQNGTDLLGALINRSAPTHAKGKELVDADGTWTSNSHRPEDGPIEAPAEDTAPPHAATIDDVPTPNLDPVIVDPATQVGSATPSDPLDAGVPPPAGVAMPDPPYETFPPAPELPNADFDQQSRVVPFTMMGVPHRLVLVPTHPPRLLMRSTEGEVIEKLDRAIASQTAEGDADEVAALTVAKTEAEEVLTAANAENFADHPNVETPELETLATQMQTIGTQFEEPNLPGEENVALPATTTTPALPYTPGDVIPDDVLGMPWANFQAHVLAIPNLVTRLELIDQNYDFLSGWYAKIRSWLDNHRYERNPDSTTAHNDATRVSSRLAWTVDQRRRSNLELNPETRVALPCFPAGTRVATPAGTREIESLGVGDEVWSSDPRTRERTIGRVAGLLVNRTVDLYDLTVERDIVSATGEHPFWVEELQSWLAARDLAPGMHLRTLGGAPTPLTTVARRGVSTTQTFNLAVDPHPTYFVGDGVLVHNGSYGLLMTYPWPANFKIYVGLNDADEFRNYIYIGQTKQTLRTRENQHHTEARDYLATHASTAPDHFFFRFKLEMRITAIAVGIRDKTMASYLEQTNINIERRDRGESFVVNRREEVTDMVSLRAALRTDTDVLDKGYCI